MGMDSMMAVEIKQTLEREFDTFLTTQDIRNLNFAKLVEMDNSNSKGNVTQTKSNEAPAELPGMQLLVRVLGNEDITPEICIELPTKRDTRKIKAFLLAGIEGSAQVFNPLVSKIRPITICLQHAIINIGLTHTSIPDIANYLLPVRTY